MAALGGGAPRERAEARARPRRQASSAPPPPPPPPPPLRVRAQANAPRRELGDKWWRVLLGAKHAAAPRQRHQPHGLAPARAEEVESGEVKGRCAGAVARGRGEKRCARRHAERRSRARPRAPNERGNGEREEAGG